MEQLLYLIGLILVLWAQIGVQGAYKKYKNKPNNQALTGSTVARKILDRYGLHDVQIEVVQQELGDHYAPSEKVVRLSPSIAHDSTIASISVAAHECGHAIQHATGYGMIGIRNRILPFAILSNKLSWAVLMLGFVFGITDMIYIGAGLLGIIAVFQLATLPIELNASSRALKIIKEEGFADRDELIGCKKMLNAAAFTYVAALISSLLQVARLVLIANRRRD